MGVRTTEGRADGEVVGVGFGFTVGDNDAVGDDVGGVVARNSRRSTKWVASINNNTK